VLHEVELSLPELQSTVIVDVDMEQLSVIVVVVAIAPQADTVVKLVRGQSWEAPLDVGAQ